MPITCYIPLQCLKESYVKATGVGIGHDLQAVEFQINTNELSPQVCCMLDVLGISTLFGLFLKAIPFYFILDNGDLIFLAFGDFQNEVLSYDQFAVSSTLLRPKEMVQSATVILKHLFAITADTLTCSLTNFQGYYADRPMNLQIFL